MVKDTMSNLKTKDYERMNTTELVHVGTLTPARRSAIGAVGCSRSPR
jgi:hypothetical protein